MIIKLQRGAKISTKKIPQNSGVYFFKRGEKILYIGKALNLRARLHSYFQSGPLPPKTSALLKEAKGLSWEILSSETEALIREAELIKKHLPKYNVLMRDDKQYFFVGFTKETFPKIFVTHQKKSGAKYIGPFTEGGALRTVLKLLRHAFPYCTCLKPHKNLCLNAKIGRCLGICCIKLQKEQISSLRSFSLAQPLAPRFRPFHPDHRSGTLLKRPQNPLRNESAPFEKKTYQQNISAIKKILSGKNKSLAQALKKEMTKLSDKKLYEEAGKIRDKIKALEKIFSHSAVIKKDSYAESAKAIGALSSLLKIPEIKRVEAYDVANIQGKYAYGSMAVWEEGNLQKNAYRIFKIRTLDQSNDPAMVNEVLSRRFKHTEWQYPQVIIVDGGRAQLEAALVAKPPSKIIALTKNEKHMGDHLFLETKKEQMPINQLPEALKNFILLLDSEAHRFAISHYRKAHRKHLTQI